MNENTLTFWNKCHEEKNIFGLSGTQYNTTIDYLKLQNHMKSNLKVLEIGVGIGYTLKGCYEKGMLVSGVDVSEIALECVKPYCEKTYTVDNISELPSNYFDIILCMNVVQHIVTSNLIEELRHCIRSLKNDGIFGLEFVSIPTTEDGGLNKSQNTGETLYRSKLYLEKIINELGGECELVHDVVRFYSPDWLKKPNNSGYGDIEIMEDFVSIILPLKSGTVTGTHVFHIRKKIFNE